MKLFSNLLLWSSIHAVIAAPTIDGYGNDKVKPPTLKDRIHKYNLAMKDTLKNRGPSEKCSPETVSIRKQWGDMPREERVEYTTAINCLISRASLSNPKDVPGARNRLDDFAAVHIQQTNYTHFNGHFFAWHRYFVWKHEQTLRNECGYKGSQPYWDFTIFADDPRKSPVFDGSDFSMGSNGRATAHGATIFSAFGKTLVLPAGTGGGCVTEGPFSNLTVNLGVNPTVLPPVSQVMPNNNTENTVFRHTDVEDVNPALKYNPRCLRRDINLSWSNQTRVSDVEFLLSCETVDCLEKRIDGWENPADQNPPQIHPAAHFSIGGLQNDPFASAGDPIFFLLHAQLDRMWATWQGQDLANRLYQVGGTKTPFNTPPSDPVRLNDYLSYGAFAGDVVLGDVQSTINGPFCYIYD